MTDAGPDVDIRRVANAVFLVAVGTLNLGLAAMSENVWAQGLTLVVGLTAVVVAMFLLLPVVRRK